MISFSHSSSARKMRSKYEIVKNKFESYFVKRQNMIFKRAKLNKRKQEQGESVNDFIIDL